MPIRKKKTAEDIRRRKGVSDYVHKVGRGFKQLGTEMLTPASKAGGALISAYKGEPLDITSEELTLAVLSGIVGGKPGGLPPNTVGAGMTGAAARKTLGSSAGKIRIDTKKKALKAGYTNVGAREITNSLLPPKKVRAMAATMRNTPKEVFDPLINVKYTDRLPPGTTGRNVRIGQKPGESKIQLDPKAGSEEWWHETVHSTAHATKGDKTRKGYNAAVLETSSDIANKAVARAKASNKVKFGRKFYKDDPTETHARLTSWAVDKGRKITSKEYDKAFNIAAKVVTQDMMKRSPTLYRKTLGEAAKGFRKRTAIQKKVKEGKLPDTFDEWIEGVVRSPKSKKKLTPGEMARALQDAAEAKGPPMYLRRKAGAVELPKHIKATKGKPFKIRRKAD